MAGAKENLHMLWQNMGGEDPTWKIFTDGPLLFLKSPIPCTKFQLAWGLHTEEDFKKACAFFEGNDFACFVDPKHLPQFSFHSLLKVNIIEMGVREEAFVPLLGAENVDIISIEKQEDLAKWAHIADETSDMAYNDIICFIEASWAHGGTACLMAMEKETPIGVADVSVDDHGVGLISSVGVLPPYRKKGVGSAIMNQVIALIFAEGATKVVLFAWDSALPFYKKMGFQETKRWDFHFVSPNKSYRFSIIVDLF